MLTLEMLFAVLQGLPADHLDHLDRPWYLLAVRIERALKDGLDPTAALHAALSDSDDWERRVYLRAFLHEAPVLALPDLTQRQKEALIALRYAGACSLQQLCRILAQDRSLIRRRLDVLIEKGYAVKYFRRDGAYYLAITSPLGDKAKSDVAELMQAFKQALLEDPTLLTAQQAPRHKGPTPFPIVKGEGTGLGVGNRPGVRGAPATTPTSTTTMSRESRESRKSRESRESRPSLRSRLSRHSQPDRHHEVLDVPCSAKPSRNSNASASFADATHPPRPP